MSQQQEVRGRRVFDPKPVVRAHTGDRGFTPGASVAMGADSRSWNVTG